MIRTIGHTEATLRYVEENRGWAEGLLKDPSSLTHLDEIAEGDRCSSIILAPRGASTT